MQHRALLISFVSVIPGANQLEPKLDVGMGTLAFALLRDDHIIVAADRRHTRGDSTANYKNDAGWKTMPILSGNGILGLAGHDLGEQILITAKNAGKLSGTSLAALAEEFGDWAKAKLLALEPNLATLHQPPSIEFLLAGFAQEGAIATAYKLWSPEFRPFIAQFPFKKFEVIGRSSHGALYALHRFSEAAQAVESGLALSAFVLVEITECDITVGGSPELYVIRKGEKAKRLGAQEAERLAAWAKESGAQLGKIILHGPSLDTSR